MLGDKARLAIEKHRMFGPGDVVVVGVSGGPDSVALLHWLAGYAREVGFQVHVAHLDHMLRGVESAGDAQWVQQFSQSLGLPSTVEAVDVFALRERLRLSLEDAARQARYSFFGRVVQKTTAAGVAVAHNSDDQVETVVMHWLRGTGLTGLRGMRPVMHYRVKDDLDSQSFTLRVARPLLEVWRSEVEGYLAAHSLSARVDRSNLELVFLRNRVRQQLIPYLQSYNPRFKEAILRTANIVSADEDFILTRVSEVWDTVARVEEGGVVFDLSKWAELHKSLQRHLLREAVSRLVGDDVGFGAVHFESALSAIDSGRTGVAITWPRGLVVRKTYTTFSVAFREEPRQPALELEGQRVEIPGRTKLFGTKWEVETSIESEKCKHPGHPLHADLDFARVGRELVVRRRRPGDRFRPLGMRGEKSLQDFFVDAKVPEEQRDEVPIVVSSQHLVWVVGLRIDDRVKVTPQTKEILCLRFAESAPEVKRW